MRIVSGKHAGRDLAELKDSHVRPTAEHVRVAMVDMVREHLTDASVLDLFAGTGALGLEAISRGARRCDFLETRASSLHTLKANIGLLRYKSKTRVFKQDAVPFAARLSEGADDIAFADPPYGSRMLDHVIKSWQSTRFSKVLMTEHSADHEMPKGGITQQFDDTAITLYRL